MSRASSGGQPRQRRRPVSPARRRSSPGSRPAASSTIASTNGPYGSSTSSWHAPSSTRAALGVDLGGELRHEAALAHPGLGHDEDEQRVPGAGQLPLAAQHVPLGRPADERRVVGEQRRAPAAARVRRVAGGRRRTPCRASSRRCVRPELAEQRRHVRLHRALRDVQPGRDLGVRQMLADEPEHLGLARARRSPHRSRPYRDVATGQAWHRTVLAARPSPPGVGATLLAGCRTAGRRAAAAGRSRERRHRCIPAPGAVR